MRKSGFVLGLCLLCTFVTLAQSKPPITRADYGQWESVAAAGARGGFSPNAAWIGYTVTRSDRTADLRLLRLSDNTVKTVASGSQLAYASDSKWAAYSIGYTEAEQERMRTERRPIQNKLGLIDLGSGEQTTIEGIQSFSFSGNGRYLAMRRYMPTATPPAGGATPPPAATPPAAGAAQSETVPLGATVIVRDLASGRDTTFGNVGEFVWQDDERTHLLAMTISADGQSGNGVHLFNPETTVLRVLDSAAAGYTGLTWRKDSTDLVVLKSKTDTRREGPTQLVVAWRGLTATGGTRSEFDPTSGTSMPAGMRTVSFRRPSWSEDGGIVFVGIATWKDRPAPARGRGAGAGAAAGTSTPAEGTPTPPPPADPPAGETPTGGGRGTGPAGGRGAGTAGVEADEPATVDVWHWTDVDVMARQKLSVAADRRRNLLAAWHLGSGRFVQIGKSFTEQVTPIAKSDFAYVEEWQAYAMDRTIGRPSADLFLVHLTSGDRTKLKDRVDDRYAQVSPAGRYVLFLQDDHYWTINLATRTTTNITKGVATSFIDRESDATVRQKPPFGVAGWTKDDGALLLYDKLDIWQVQPDGSRPTRLTNGAADQVRHRLVRVNPDETAIDLSAASFVSLFGLRSKKSGYGVLAAGEGVDRAVWFDKSVTGLARAKQADTYAYMVQAHDDSPDIFVGGATLAGARQVTTTNAFQSKFAWSRSEIVDYKTDKGLSLQGALYYPAGYEPGKAYPMIVYLYEKLSDNVHRYVAPSDRDYYNTTVFTSQGYFVLQPDIVFRPREPGLSVVEAVTPAVKKVVTTGMVDAKRVGVVGHSWGGFDTAYLATHTTGVFSAAVAGAAITNLVSNYGNHHWSSGIAETDHIETGQQRMEVPLWEDLPAYIRNSAVFNVQQMTTPLLVMTGDSDGTVYWHQGVELYNIARRAKKNVVMLVYTGEDHGLRQKKNQVDYQRRILEWFGHYLKGDAAQPWITRGVSALERQP